MASDLASPLGTLGKVQRYFQLSVVEEFTTSIEGVKVSGVAECPTMRSRALSNEEFSDPLPLTRHCEFCFINM